MKKILAALLAGCMAAVSLAACNTYTDNGSSSTPSSSTPSSQSGSSDSSSSGSEPSSAASAEPMSFTFIGGNPVTLNPILSQSTDDGNSFYLLQASLFRYYDDQVQNDLCESYDVSDDELTYTFHLRDAVWSDGEPITAEQFAYAIQCYTSPDMGSPAASNFDNVAGANEFNAGEGSWEDVGVKALDEKTLEITLIQPEQSFVLGMATSPPYPLRQDFVEAQGEKLGSSPEAMQFSGPYVLTDWKLDSSLTFTKNDKYWNAENAFPVETITLLKVDDANTSYSMFESGEVDALAGVSAQYYDALKEYSTTQSGGEGLMYLWINQNGLTSESGKVLANNNFRLALNYALDRESTVAALTATQIPYSRLIQPIYPGSSADTIYTEEYAVESAPLGGDVEKAKEYLAKALEELELSDVSELPQITFVTWDVDRQKVFCESLIDQWKQNLGITSIQLNQYPIGTAIGNYLSNQYDIFAISISAGITPASCLDNFVTGGDYNTGIWGSAEYDALVEQIKTEKDDAKRCEMIQQAEQILLTDSSVVPFYALSTTFATQPYVEGFAIGTLGAGFQFDHLTVEK